MPGSDSDRGAIAINILVLLPVLMALTFSILQMGLWGAASMIVRAAAAQAVTAASHGYAMGDETNPAPGTALGNAESLIEGVGFVRDVVWDADISDGVVTVGVTASTINVVPGAGLLNWQLTVRASDRHVVAAVRN